MYEWICEVCKYSRAVADHDRRDFLEHACTGTFDRPHGRKVMELKKTPLVPQLTDDQLQESYECVEKSALEHLAACNEAMFAYDEGRGEIEDPATAPYDGCDTCIVREILTVARDELVKIVQTEAHASVGSSDPRPGD